MQLVLLILGTTFTWHYLYLVLLVLGTTCIRYPNANSESECAYGLIFCFLAVYISKIIIGNNS